ncbi:hypothetical protein M0R45_008618 [Rubus argutus]|uniref:Uncharacterized protein n=1 Tax=Rubus argutus TaxID=59490 RepID=A0AAW1Y3L1_RUBAR
MPRRSSGGRSARPASRRAPAPAPVSQAPAPAQSERSRGIGSMIAEGMAFGGGSAIAHRAVEALMGPRVRTMINNQQNEK